MLVTAEARIVHASQTTDIFIAKRSSCQSTAHIMSFAVHSVVVWNV